QLVWVKVGNENQDDTFPSYLQNCMNLPPEKVSLLNQYDSEKKWDLICDQERFQVRSPPSVYIQKLRGFLDQGGVSRKFKRRIQESAQVLRELEISLRTNHIGWVQEFLNDDNKGLDVLVDYLAFTQSAVTAWQPLTAAQCSPNLPHPITALSVAPSYAATLYLPTISLPTLAPSLRSTLTPKDDVHVCIMCLRAIMNYQSGFNLVMQHHHCVNEITLSLNNWSARTKALVLELLAAVCLVRGGHDIIMSAFDNFQMVCGEKRPFEKLMEYFQNEDGSIDFMVACMQFINIVVHSVEDMNFRVHLQFVFTALGLDKYLEVSPGAGLGAMEVGLGVIGGGAGSEEGGAGSEGGGLTEKLQESENDTMSKVAELEKQLMQAQREAEQQRVSVCVSVCVSVSVCLRVSVCGVGGQSIRMRSPIQTKFRMPLLNWASLQPNQITGTVFTELNDEKLLQELNMADFEERFQTKAQKSAVDINTIKAKAAQKCQNKVSLIEGNRAKNLAITLRKGGLNTEAMCQAIDSFDLQSLSLDFLELLTRFVPTECERKVLERYEAEGRPLAELGEEDRFMIKFSKIPRLDKRMDTMIFMGNFSDTAQRLTPQLNAVIAASMSIKSSTKLKKILEIILAFGNYMNSSKKGMAYGFRLKSLDQLLETKSTDRKQTLMSYMVDIVNERYPELSNFHTDLLFLDKAAAVSLDSVVQDVRGLERGMELARKEILVQDSMILKEFLSSNNEKLEQLQRDSTSAQEAYSSVVEYFGENVKTTQPSTFFQLFTRFIKAYKQDNQNRQREEAAQEAPVTDPTNASPQDKKKPPFLDLMAELKKKQNKERIIYDGKDGAIEDIITDLRNQPYRPGDAMRRSARKRVDEQTLRVSGEVSL
uniref:Formin like 1 n=1 Tax=Callorhinchus milii TaxID=7868 RepID=A0A4W3HVB1_CALMI